MNAELLSRQLRLGRSAGLGRRRALFGLSLVSTGAMAVIALYQMGIIKHLPELPLPGLDADRIDASDEAYSRFMTPDAALGISSFGLTATLAAMGGEDRAERQPLIALAFAAKLAFDLAQAGRLTITQWTQYRAFCMWCLIAAGATFAQAPLALPEARAAWKALRAAADRGALPELARETLHDLIA